MTFPKPEPRDKEKRRQKRQHAILRSVCVEHVWQRDRSTCVICKRPVRRTATIFSSDIGHVDEILPRSLGGDDTDPVNCRLVCHACHFSGPSGAHRITVRPEAV